jgi:hypothetical protein
MASCLKTLWSLDSPSYDQLTGSPIAEDVEGEDDEGINSTTHSLPVDSGEHRFTRIDSRASDDGLHISKGKSLEVKFSICSYFYFQMLNVNMFIGRVQQGSWTMSVKKFQTSKIVTTTTCYAD